MISLQGEGVLSVDGEFWRGSRIFGVVESVWGGEVARSAVCVVGRVEQIACILSRARLGQWDERQPGEHGARLQSGWALWRGSRIFRG